MRTLLLAFVVSTPVLAEVPSSLDCHEFFIGPPRDRVFATIRLGTDGKLAMEVGTQTMKSDGSAGTKKASQVFAIGTYTQNTRYYWDARKKGYAENGTGADWDLSGMHPTKNTHTALLRYWDGPFKYTNASLTVKEGTRETATPSMQCRRVD